ncbi:MAG: transglycosylase SLT domain-containing protein [Micrococcales bacterium]|nr:transglycosylase SLT domain-containing protein [Micrococcales bacterium]
MTVEVSGIVAAQARVQEIQSRFGIQPQNTVQPAASAASGSTGSFGASLARARNAGTPATAAAPFVWDPGAAPGQLIRKPGAAAALAAPPVTQGTAPVAAGPTGVGGSTATPAVDGVDPTSAVAPVEGVAGTSKVDALLATAKKYLGVPYKWGGTDPRSGLDCSGFTQLVFKQHGYQLPRVARQQQNQGVSIPSLADAKPGDLVTFGRPATHIGIYLGNNKMIHAPRTGDVVKVSTLWKTPSSIRRILPVGSDQPQVTRGGTAGRADQVALPTASIDASAVQAAVTSAAANAAAMSSVSSSSAGGLGGWAGSTPAPDTWGAAVAAASGSPSGRIPAASVATNAVAAPSSVASIGPLAQAPASLQKLFVEAGRKHGVPAQLLAAVAKQESDFTPTAVSRAGARGLMQLMPATARGLGVRDAFDPAQAVDGAARLLRDHLKSFGSTRLALAAYNAGPGAVRRYDGVPPYAETQNYVRKIMANLSTAGA